MNAALIKLLDEKRIPEQVRAALRAGTEVKVEAEGGCCVITLVKCPPENSAIEGYQIRLTDPFMIIEMVNLYEQIEIEQKHEMESQKAELRELRRQYDELYARLLSTPGADPGPYDPPPV